MSANREHALSVLLNAMLLLALTLAGAGDAVAWSAAPVDKAISEGTAGGGNALAERDGATGDGEEDPATLPRWRSLSDHFRAIERSGPGQGPETARRTDLPAARAPPSAG